MLYSNISVRSQSTAQKMSDHTAWFNGVEKKFQAAALAPIGIAH
jgi:hypothetical protein